MVSFEIFVKAMPPSLLELKVLPSFCFPFKIPDDVTASTKGHLISKCLFGVDNFLQKWKENKSHSSKIEFFCSFFGGKGAS